jgi:predicted polyphosphate/ATP-dependent NAD kinase
VSRIKDEIQLITYPHEMGEDEALKCGFSPTVVGSIMSGETTQKNTRQAAQEMVDLGVELILFAGGDGTARDIHDAVGQTVPAVGIPAGVKIHSAVYALTPRHAGEVAVLFLGGRLLRVRDAEVMDIDEEAFRQGMVSARLYGYLRVPEERRHVQSVKSGGVHGEAQVLAGIATEVIQSMAEDCLYIVGPGTTTRAIVEELELDNTLLGVDVLLNRRLVAGDANEGELLALIGERKAKIVVTVIGGQGYIFGRGNQQLGPRVIRKVGVDNIIVVASKEKLGSLAGRPLLVDTGDEDLDQTLGGYVRITTGFRDYVMYKVGTQYHFAT